MLLRTFSVIIFFLFVTTNMCRAKIPIPDSHLDVKNARLIGLVIKLLRSCYVDRINPVALAGEIPDPLITKLAVEYSIPVVLINHTTRKTTNQYRTFHQFRQFRQQLQVFIIGATSVDKFAQLMIKEVVPSIWWNHTGSFVILNFSSLCENTFGLLAIAWQMGILDVNVVCLHREQRIYIFTYNPYKNEAPSSWKKFFDRPAIDDHPLTVFIKRREKYADFCENLHFKKTNDLGGYKIKVFVPDQDKIAYAGSLQTSNYLHRTSNRIWDIISRAMNATLVRNTRPGDIFRDVFDEIDEIPGCMFSIEHAQMAYPHDKTGIVLISQFRGHKSQLDKILKVIDLASRIGLGIVYLITFIFFRFFLRQPSMSAILNLVRITCDTGFENISRNNPTRIFLSALLLFVVTMQGIHQGNLACLLTTHIPLRSLNTWNDIVDLGYNVYGLKSLKLLIDNQDVIERFIEIESLERCVEYAMNNSLGACIGNTPGYLLDQARELKMHVSTEVLVPLYIAFHIQQDWPLEQRFNEIIQKMFEADVLKLWPARFNETKLTEFEYDNKVMSNKVFKNIELHEVLFAFIILGIGLVCATITFVGELVVHRFRSRVVTVRVQILN